MFVQLVRTTIVVLVWIIVIVRTPVMLRDRYQRPLWVVLSVIAFGSIAIQSWMANFVNKATKITEFNGLLQGALAVVDVAVVLEFVVHLASIREPIVNSRRMWRIGFAILIFCGMVAFFALTPPSQRFKPLRGTPTFAGYVILVGFYLLAASIVITWLLWRHLMHIRDLILQTSLSIVMLGSAAEVPFIALRTAQRWARFNTPGLARVAFLFSTTRFILVPLGCILVVLGPIAVNSVYRHRYTRLYPMWHLLRSATAELAPFSSDTDFSRATTQVDVWEQLHRRVVEIRDSSFYLLDRWSWPELLDEATLYAHAVSRLNKERQVAVACWLDVTRRIARTEQPRTDSMIDRALLPEMRGTRSTVGSETRYLTSLYRTMRSRQVVAFSETVVIRQRKEKSGQ